MADQAILREYLVALGFKVDQAGQKKFQTGILSLDKGAVGLGKSLLGVAVASQVMVGIFSHQMEKLYYASKRTGSTASNIKALEFGAEQIGLSGDAMRQSLESMARAMRSNPGLAGMLNSLGVRVTGRDRSDVLKDMVGQLAKMPFYVAEKYAAMFGMDSDTLFMLIQGREEMEKAEKLRKDAAAGLGVDTDKAAEAGKNMMNSWREILMYVDLVKDALSLAMVGPMTDMASVTKLVLADWVKIIHDLEKYGTADFWQRIREGITGKAEGPRVTLAPGRQADLDQMNANNSVTPTAPAAPLSSAQKAGRAIDRFFGVKPKDLPGQMSTTPMPAGVPPTPGNVPPVAPPVAQTPPGTRQDQAGRAEKMGLLSRLEKQFALPDGLLGRVWKKESSEGKRMLGPMTRQGQAKGHFQFMDPTAKQYGVTDPNNLENSATGAAKYLANLLKRYKGDERAAVGAYNWGEGNMDQYRLGKKRLPDETRDYMDTVAAPVTITQNTNIHVTGTSDAKETAAIVAENQFAQNADLARNFKTTVR